VEDNVFAGDTGWELAVDLNSHVLAAAGNKGLGSEDVLDFTSSDTEGESTEGTVGGGVTVTADDSCAGQGETLLGSNDVDNTLALVTHTEVGQAEVFHILLQSRALETRVVLLDKFLGILEVFP
jgi:hypothetical protein